MVAFLLSSAGLNCVMISYIRMLHITANAPLMERRIAAEHKSLKDEIRWSKTMPGNKEAIWASER